jgi:hypothetical protein
MTSLSNFKSKLTWQGIATGAVAVIVLAHVVGRRR